MSAVKNSICLPGIYVMRLLTYIWIFMGLLYIAMRGLRGVLYEGLTREDSSITEGNVHVIGNRLNIWYREKHQDSNEIFSLIFN